MVRQCSCPTLCSMQQDTSSSRAAHRGRLLSQVVPQRQGLAWWMGLAVAGDKGSSVVVAKTDQAPVTHCVVLLQRCWVASEGGVYGSIWARRRQAPLQLHCGVQLQVGGSCVLLSWQESGGHQRSNERGR